MYREDLEAAQARVKTLEGDLERTKKDLEDARSEVAERNAVKAEVATLRARAKTRAVILAGVCVAVIAGSFALIMSEKQKLAMETARLLTRSADDERAHDEKKKMLRAKERVLGMEIPLESGEPNDIDWLKVDAEMTAREGTLKECCPTTPTIPATLGDIDVRAVHTFTTEIAGSFSMVVGMKNYYAPDSLSNCLHDKLSDLKSENIQAKVVATHQNIRVMHRYRFRCG